jgi:hypothetical protein
VSEKLALGCIGERPVVGQFVDLADVVQKCSREKEIPVDLRIIPAHEVARSEERHDVVEQASDESMVEGLGSGSIAVRRSDPRIGHERLHEGFQMRVLKSGDKVRESLPKLVDVFGCFRKVIRKHNLRLPELA